MSWIAGRYRLERCLASRSQGDVHIAFDAFTGRQVVVKRIALGADRGVHDARGEAAALRLLRLPGVAVVLDDGVHDEYAFVVTEWIDGTPYPGRTGPCTWSDIRAQTIALLECIGRVHSAGVVHRDLKPGNVLVTPDGQPIVIDFGIAAHARAPTTPGAYFLGTPRYTAPEQVSGQLVDARADLYAIGVMVFEALAGRAPFAGDTPFAQLQARLAHAPPRLVPADSDAARGVPVAAPAHICEVVQQLLAMRPADRPQSAGSVVEAITSADDVSDTVPWLGSHAVLDALALRIEAGESVALHGPAGIGKSRLLRALDARLTTRRFVWLERSDRPFGSLAPMLTIDAAAAASLDAVTAASDAAVDALLDAGSVLVADDFEHIDRRSREVVTRRQTGRIIIVRRRNAGGDMRMAPLTKADLVDLFEGPSRLFHLPIDAAQILHERTAGIPARIVGELRAWCRAGLARRVAGRFSVDRAALRWLTANVAPLARQPSQARATTISAALLDLVDWIRLLGSAATVDLLATVSGRPMWTLQADVEDLSTRGVVLTIGGCLVAANDAPPVDPEPETRKARHRIIAAALPADHPERLRHLLSAGDLDTISAALRARTDALLAQGQLTEALAVFEGVARLALPWGDLALRPSLVAWLDAALSTADARAVERFEYHLRVVDGPHDLTHLARAALTILGNEPATRRLIDELAPFAEGSLEIWRQALRMKAARRRSVDDERALLKALVAWADETPSRISALRAWEARLAYREYRFDEAITGHLAAAQSKPRLTDQLSCLLNAASAALAGFRHAQAIELAEQGGVRARDARLAYFEARAAWIHRSAAYRLGELTTPDPALVEAAGLLGDPHLRGALALNEAAIAWRAGQQAHARMFAGICVECWRQAANHVGVDLARALRFAAGGALDEECAVLVARAQEAHLPRVGAQTLALLRLGGAASAVDSRLLTKAQAVTPKRAWDMRCEVLSLTEVLSSF